MTKLLIPLALLAVLSACVPVAPVQPDVYDLPAHCSYDAYGQVICTN
ncbi:hypothetical protein [Gymnodinialimonas sp.]